MWSSCRSVAEPLVEVLSRARALGFLGSGPVGAHVAHAEAYVRAWGAPPPGRVIDLGSGGGIPGLVLATRWPTSCVALLEASARRAAFLSTAVDSLGFGGRVWVVHARAEVAGRDPALRGTFDLVCARSFGPPAVTAECGAPFLRVGGRLIVSEPPRQDRDRWAVQGLAALGLGPATTVGERPRLVVCVQQTPCPVRYPRRVGIPAKRPLW